MAAIEDVGIRLSLIGKGDYLAGLTEARKSLGDFGKSSADAGAAAKAMGAGTSAQQAALRELSASTDAAIGSQKAYEAACKEAAAASKEAAASDSEVAAKRKANADASVLATRAQRDASVAEQGAAKEAVKTEEDVAERTRLASVKKVSAWDTFAKTSMGSALGVQKSALGVAESDEASASRIESAGTRKASAWQRFSQSSAGSALGIKSATTGIADADEASAAKIESAGTRKASAWRSFGGAATAGAGVATTAGVGVAESEAATAAKIEASNASKSKSIGAFANSYKMVGLGVIAVAGAIVVSTTKMAGDFQQSTTRLVTSAGETDANLKMVQQGILTLSGQVGYSAENMATAMYKVESGGYHGAAGLDVLKAAAQGAKTENADLTTVADAVTSAMTDYAGSGLSAADVTSKLVAATGAGKMTFQELAGSMSAILPIASVAHVSLNDILGDMASMTMHGMSAQQASQNLADAIRHLQAPTGTMKTAFAELGVNANDLTQNLGQRGLSGTVDVIGDAIQKKMGPDAASVIINLKGAMAGLAPPVQDLANKMLDGSISAGDYIKQAKLLPPELQGQAAGLATLAKSTHALGSGQADGATIMSTYGAQMRGAMGDATGMNVALMIGGQNAKNTAGAIGAVTVATADAQGNVKGWTDIQGTLNQKMSEAKAGLGSLGIELGSVFLPILSTIMGPIATFATWISSNKDAAVALAIVIGGVVVAALALLAVALWAVVVPMIVASAPLLIIIGLFALVGLAVYEIQAHWSGIAAWFGEQWTEIKNLFAPIGQWFVGQWDQIKSVFTAVSGFFQQWGVVILAIFMPFIGIPLLVIQNWGPISSFFVTQWDQIKSVFTTSLSFVENLWNTVWAAVTGFFVTQWGQIKSVAISAWNAISSFFTAAWNAELAGWKAIWTAVRDFFVTIWNFIRDTALSIWNTIYGFYKGVWATYKADWTTLWNAVRDLFVTIWNFVRDTAISVWNAIVAFFRAGWATYKAEWTTLWSAVRDFFVTIWNFIRDTGTSIWNAIVAFFRAGWATYKAEWTTLWTAVRDFFVTIWNFIKDTGTTVWNAIVAFFTTAWAAYKAAWTTLWTAVRDFFVGIWTTVKDTAISIWNAIATFFTGAWDNFKKGWQGLVNEVGTIWDGIKKKVADPINWVINIVWNKGIVPAWNAVAGLLGLPPAPTVAPLALAEGGHVSGAGTATSDSIPALLSNGEFVVREAIVRDHGPFLAALNSGQAEAVQAAAVPVGAYAAGGVISAGTHQRFGAFIDALDQRHPDAQRAAGGRGARMPGYDGGGLVVPPGGGVPPATQRALDFGRSMAGTPYIWGGTGPAGMDCSGFMGAVTQSLRGQNPFGGRLGTTETMPWPGFVSGLTSSFAVGDHRNPDGHTAGTLNGTNMESGSGHGAMVGGAALGATSGYFGEHFSLPEVGGAFVAGNAGTGGGVGAMVAQLAVHAALDPVIAGLTSLANSMFHPPPESQAVPAAFIKTAGDKVVQFLLGKAAAKDAASAAASGGGAAGPGSAVNLPGNVTDWANQALALTGRPQDLQGILQQIKSESGGNPNAVNNTDSNAQAGHPSQGILQMIPSTFSQYMLPGHGNILNPVDNIAAADKYGVAKYGDGFWAPGPRHNSGYDNGGPLMPGYTHAFNGSGQPENVVTDAQWRSALAAKGQVAAASVVPSVVAAALSSEAGGGGGGARDGRIVFEAGAITIHESSDPSASYDAVQRAVSDSIARQ